MHRKRKIPWAAEDTPKMLTQEQNKIKVEMTWAFVLELTFVSDDSSRIYS